MTLPSGWTLKHQPKKRQVEISANVGPNYTAVKIIVGLDGYDYKYYERDARWASSSTRGRNVHIAMNGPLQLTFDEMHLFMGDLDTAVMTAKRLLESA